MGLIRSGSNWTEDSAHLACSHAATLNDDDFELDELTEDVIPKNKKWDFMKKIEDLIDKNDQIQQERLVEMKRLIMEQMKKTIKKKLEVRGDKRGNDEPAEDPNVQSKPRVISPEKI